MRRLATLQYAALIAFSCLSIANSFSLDSQIQELIEFHDKFDRPPRSLLQRRHAADFPGDTAFQSFARILCQTNAVPRKELFEAWSTALYIQEKFPECRRIADLCCGHSLLSFALLVLDEENMHKNQVGEPRSAVCIDKRMPASAEKVADVMFDQYPQFAGRWDFVEGKLDAITTTTAPSTSKTHPKTLLCGIHACGTLSDRIISLAINGNLPLALMPCCHTKKSLDQSALHMYNNGGYDLSELVDLRRKDRLQKADYNVGFQSIPKSVTPKNLLILASPSIERRPLPRRHLHSSSVPPLFSIPIDGSAQSRTIIRTIAGRSAANQRKKEPPISFCVSLSMTSRDSVTTSSLAGRAKEAFYDTDLTVKVEYADDEPFWHAPSARYFRTFRITYFHRESLAPERQTTKKLHDMLCREILLDSPGTEVRC